MSQAAVASPAPAQADTTQFDMSSAVPETEDGKAVSAMPAFDLSSAVPEDQISRAQPKSWEEQVMNFISAPFRKSPEDRQAEAANIYAISKSTGMSMEDVSKNYDQLSRNPKITGMMPEPTKGQVIGGVMMEGMLAPVAAEGGIAAGALLTAKGIAGLGVFTGINALVQYGKDKLLPQDTNQGAKDAIDLAGLAAGGLGAHAAGEALEKGVGSLVDSMVGNIMPHAPDAVPTMDLAAEHIKAITDSKLPDDAKIALLARLGVNQDHIDASVASGKPIRVPLTNVLDMASSPYWDDIAGEITENGLPKTGIDALEQEKIEKTNPLDYKTADEYIASKNLETVKPREDIGVFTNPEHFDTGKPGISDTLEYPSKDRPLLQGNGRGSLVYRDSEGKPQGVLTLKLREDGKIETREDYGANVEVKVNPDYQRQGIATELYNKAKELGYDVDSVEGRVFTKDGLELQKSRLTDEFNKAHNEVDPPISPMTGGLQEETGKFGEHNTLFTEAMANEAREAFNSKMSGLHSGIDPTAIGDLLKIGGYHFEGGVREFGAWSEKVINEMGERVRPYLKQVWDDLQKQAPKMAQPKVEATEDELAKQEYFPLKPLGIKEVVGKRGEVDLNKTGRDIVKRYLGRYQEQVVRVQDLADDMRGLEKDKDMQNAQGMFASVGSKEKLQEWIDKADNEIKEGHYNYDYWKNEARPIAVEALNLSDGAMEGIKLGNQYYRESGLAMKSVGAIRSFLEGYGTIRLYQDEPVERSLKGNDYDNFQQTTKNALRRKYVNFIDAIMGGKRLKTMNYPDLIGIHGEEAASVTVGRQYAQESAPKDMGDWFEKGKVPAGWKQVGNMSRDIPMRDKDTKEMILDEQKNQKILRQVFAAPAAIADDLSVITDPDNLKKVGFMQKAGALNNAVKSFNVMIGVFHDKQFILQKLASPGGVKGLKDTFTGQLGALMQTKDFKEARLRMLRTGVGMSGKIQANIDVIKVANAQGAENSWLNKITSLPIIKQAAQLVDWHKNNLFQVMGEYYKVDNFRRNTAQWELKNPNATEEERLQADRGYAQASNNAFGGHNWAGLGFSKEAITAARAAWFAPDWLYSALRTGSSAITDWKGIAGSQGTEGNATRAIVIKNLIYGTAATQLANYMINGHFTDKNATGHKMEIELSPKNHISMYPAATGELVKLMSDVIESGAIGVSRYLQGKLSPILRLDATWASHTSYSGQDITKETGGIGAVAAKPVPEEYKDAIAKQVNYVAELASTIAPVPFVAQPGPMGYVGEQVKNAVEGKKADLAGVVTLPSGISRFSQGESPERQQQDIDTEVEKGLENKDDTAAKKYLASGDISQAKIDELQAKADETPLEKSYKSLSVEKIIKKADGNIDSMDADDKDSLKTMLNDKYDRMVSANKASPNEIKRIGDLLEDFYDKHKIQ